MEAVRRLSSPRETPPPENNKQAPFDCSDQISKLKTAIFFVFSLPCQALKNISKITALSFSKITASALSCYRVFVEIFTYKESSYDVFEREMQQAKESAGEIIFNDFVNLEQGLQDIATLPDRLSRIAKLDLIKHCLENNQVDQMGQLLKMLEKSEKNDAKSFYTDVCENFRSADMFVLLKSHGLTQMWLLSKVICDLDLDTNNPLFEDLLNLKDPETWENVLYDLWIAPDTPQRSEKISAIFSKRRFDSVTVQRLMLTHLESNQFQKDRDGSLIETLINSMPKEIWNPEPEKSNLSNFIAELQKWSKQSAHAKLWEKFIEAVQDKCSEPPMTKFAGKLD